MPYLISDLFKYSHLVLASVTYNLGIFPPMHNFLMDLKALNLQKRTCAIVENGSWAPNSGNLMKAELEEIIKLAFSEPSGERIREEIRKIVPTYKG